LRNGLRFEESSDSQLDVPAHSDQAILFCLILHVQSVTLVEVAVKWMVFLAPELTTVAATLKSWCRSIDK
jgi:hypothetical protein